MLGLRAQSSRHPACGPTLETERRKVCLVDRGDECTLLGLVDRFGFGGYLRTQRHAGEVWRLNDKTLCIIRIRIYGIGSADPS
jgi:hypothetical protein